MKSSEVQGITRQFGFFYSEAYTLGIIHAGEDLRITHSCPCTMGQSHKEIQRIQQPTEF